MSLLDKAKQAAGQAAAKAKEGVEDVQTKRDLAASYSELGKKTFELVDQRKLEEPMLTELVEKIRALKAKLEEEEEPQAE